MRCQFSRERREGNGNVDSRPSPVNKRILKKRETGTDLETGEKAIERDNPWQWSCWLLRGHNHSLAEPEFKPMLPITRDAGTTEASDMGGTQNQEGRGLKREAVRQRTKIIGLYALA